MSDKLRKAYRFATVPEHLIRDKAICDRAVRLWCLLDRYAGKDESSFPLRSTLADDLSCSRATIDRAIDELVGSGWLHKERRQAGGSNLYTLLIASLPKAAKPQVKPGGALTHEDTPPVLTHEDTPHLTSEDTPAAPVTTPVITGESHKEASPPKHQGTETPDDSLRSSSATADESTPEHTEQQPLAGMPDDPSATPVIGADAGGAGAGERTKAGKPRQWSDQAEQLARQWWEFYEATYGRVPRNGSARPFVPLSRMIQAALDAEYTEDEIKAAFLRTGNGRTPDAIPAAQRLWRELAEVRNGLPASRQGSGSPSNVHHMPVTDPDSIRRAQAW